MNPVRSAVPEISWPSLTTPKGASLLATEFRLHYGESISPDARLALQWSQLAALIRHAREHVSYYKNDLAAFEKIDGKLQDWATWEGVPLLTQSRMLEVEENVISTFVPEAHGKVVTTLNLSAGGRLLELKYTEINQHIARAIHLREHSRCMSKRKMCSLKLLTKRGRLVRQVTSATW